MKAGVVSARTRFGGTAGILAHAAGICAFVVGLFGCWFGPASRHTVFFYGHLGAGPLDPITLGRYLMAGLVASGGVLVLYGLACQTAVSVARIRGQPYTLPSGWAVWTLSAALAAPGIAGAVTLQGQPPLPWWVGAGCAAVTAAGLALAVTAGQLGAGRPSEFAWRAAAGAGLVPTLLTLRLVARAGTLGPAAAYLWRGAGRGRRRQRLDSGLRLSACGPTRRGVGGRPAGCGGRDLELPGASPVPPPSADAARVPLYCGRGQLLCLHTGDAGRQFPGPWGSGGRGRPLAPLGSPPMP